MLTTKEQEYGNSLIAYYQSPTSPDAKKVNEFIYATDTGKIGILKTFLTEVLEPQNDSEVAVYQAKFDTASAKKTAITNYTK